MMLRAKVPADRGGWCVAWRCPSQPEHGRRKVRIICRRHSYMLYTSPLAANMGKQRLGITGTQHKEAGCVFKPGADTTEDGVTTQWLRKAEERFVNTALCATTFRGGQLVQVCNAAIRKQAGAPAPPCICTAVPRAYSQHTKRCVQNMNARSDASFQKLSRAIESAQRHTFSSSRWPILPACTWRSSVYPAH